jgi:hypothetical protein
MKMKVKYKKVLIFISGFVIFIFLFIWMIFNTSFGKNLIKAYFQNEIDIYFPYTKIEKLVVAFNTFSMVLNKDGNFYKLYGQIFPFDAIIEGNIKEFEIGNKKFEQKVTLSGHIIKKNKFYLINSNIYFDNYVGILDANLSKKNKIFNFKTKSLNIKYIFDKLSIPYIEGLKAKADLNLLDNNNHYTVFSDIKGIYKNNKFNSKIKFDFVSLNNVKLKGIVKSKILEGYFNAGIKDKIIYNANFNKFDLSLIDLIYPFRGIVNLKVKKDESGIIKFSSNYFKGFKDNNLNVEFSMSVDRFFNYVNLYNIFEKGIVTGRIVIVKNKKGIFNFIIQKAELKKEIVKKLKLSNYYFDKIFVKGSFNNKGVFFNLLTNDKNKVIISIKNGFIPIKDLSPSFRIIISFPKKREYYKFYNKKLFLIKNENLDKSNNQILVY